MVQDIKYNGYTTNPSDYECPDGDLATAINVIPEDGTLKPVLPPQQLFSLPEVTSPQSEKYELLCIHQTSAFTHYIIVHYYDVEPRLYWCDSSDYKNLKEFYTFDHRDNWSLNNVKIMVEPVGNVLYLSAIKSVPASFDGLETMFFIWDNGIYKTLRNPPFIPIEFHLKGMNGSSDFTKNVQVSGTNAGYNAHDVSNVISGGRATGGLLNDLSNAVWGVILSRISETGLDNNYFHQPFFIRYACRLYDGSHILHSAPVLLTPNTCLKVLGQINNPHTELGTLNLTVNPAFEFTQLFYRFVLDKEHDAHKSLLTDLENWKSLITHIDFFISAPIYYYDQSKQIQRYTSIAVYKRYTDAFRHCDGVESTYVDANNYSLKGWDIPHYSLEEWEERIRDCANFYLVSSISVEDVIKQINGDSQDSPSTGNRPGTTTSGTDSGLQWTVLPMEKGTLKSLETRPALNDDYNTHCHKVAKFAYNYNSRLNLANVYRKLFSGYPIRSMVQYRKETTDDSRACYVAYIVHLRKEGVEYSVLHDIDRPGPATKFNPDLIHDIDTIFPRFLFYPDPDAYKITACLCSYTGGTQASSRKYTIPLIRHNTLNGAYYFRGMKYSAPMPEHTDRPSFVIPASDGDDAVLEGNKIYTSNPDNPFFFDTTNINTVGMGTILGISTAAKALSQGQFGQFPLYAFTSEGVWALEVSNVGTFSAKQPITRDVVINPGSITQIDNAVLFASDRGIMLISGSSAQCISDSIRSADIFSVTGLPKADKLIPIFNSNAGADLPITLDNITPLPFNDFLKGCRMIYDYTHQRVIVYNPDVDYAYVYSFKSQGWGMMLSDIVSSLDSYPNAIAVNSSGHVVDFCRNDESAVPEPSFVITRPFKLGSPDIFKTIDTVIQRGHFRSNHVKQILYASNDLFDWHIIWSSTDRYMRGFSGSPYKFFRLALVCDFDKSESLYGFSVQFTPRMTGQLR